MLAAVTFLTIAGTGSAPTGRSLRWFPVVGALLGAAVGGTWWAASLVFGPVLAAALAVAVDLVLTGLLHLDGLADSADGLLPHLDRDRRLAVMADPATGAFGAAAVALAVVLRTAAFASNPVEVDGRAVLLVAALWAGSRSAMALVAVSRPYARPGGLATAFIGERNARLTAALGLAAALAVAVAACGFRGLGAVAGLTIGAVAVATLAERRIGGFTGDVLGALGVAGETVGLVVAAARW